MSPTPHSPLTCNACRIIDKMDGTEDGHVFNLEHWKVADERRHWKYVKDLRDFQDRAADKVTRFAGSLNFVYMHTAWFGVWILLNVTNVIGSKHFDGFPFGLLTMIVSLEAIFLSTFVMVSQNRQAARSDLRSQVDFESNLQSLIWLVHLGEKLDIDIAHVQQLCGQAIEESRKA